MKTLKISLANTQESTNTKLKLVKRIKFDGDTQRAEGKALAEFLWSNVGYHVWNGLLKRMNELENGL